MPFQETYAVDFFNGNLKPHVNVLGWPDMRLSTWTSSDRAERIPEPMGLTLAITRDLTVSVPAKNSIYVDLTTANVTLDTRLVMRVTFDSPSVELLPESGADDIPEPWAV